MPPIVKWVSEGQDIKKTREFLFEKGILNNDWKRFFEKIELKNDEVSRGYKTRLFLLKKWHETWAK